MKKMKNAVVLILTLVLISSCAKSPEFPSLSSADSLVIVQDNTLHRQETEAYFAEAPGSPFVKDTTVEFNGLHWFPINPRFRGLSKLHRYDNPETVTVMGTKGEARRQLRYGYFEFVVPDTQGHPATIRINAYKFTPYDKRRYELYRDNLSVWFTDRTTGKETYHVGRYVEIGDEQSDLNHVYSIDLNKAYNPYCAYSDMFSCAIPRKEDHVDLALRVGEMKYHE
ncbi:MAG: DUF1684 domain-containing protein [Bacteroidota bacterium]